MTEQPVAGSLQARLIRACKIHTGCPLECPEREVEDLGEVARFDHRHWRARLAEWVQQQRLKETQT